MRRSTTSLWAAGLVGACALVLAAGRPAGADWLVTREGARVETRGAWQEKGRLVVFTGADGTLASLRLADVDLEASRQATADAVRRADAARAAAAAPKSPPPPRRRSVLVLTDKELPPVGQGDPAEGTEGTGEPGAGEPGEAAATGGGLAVTSWERVEEEGVEHVVLTGTLANDGPSSATDLGLAVRVFDEDGQLMATTNAVLAAEALAPGESGDFRAELPGVFAFSAVRFEPRSLNLAVQPEPNPATGDGD